MKDREIEKLKELIEKYKEIVRFLNRISLSEDNHWIRKKLIFELASLEAEEERKEFVGKVLNTWDKARSNIEQFSQQREVTDEEIEKWADITAIANSISPYKWGLIEGAIAMRDGKINNQKK